MKILKTVQNHYATLGVSSSKQLTKKYPFSERVFFGFFLFVYLLVSELVYIYYVAIGFMEYMDCICTISTSIIIFVCFMAIVHRKTTLFESIENLEKLIETSEPLLSFHL